MDLAARAFAATLAQRSSPPAARVALPPRGGAMQLNPFAHQASSDSRS
jgi:hypothetical protein